MARKEERLRDDLEVMVRYGHLGMPNLRHAFLMAVTLSPSSSAASNSGLLKYGFSSWNVIATCDAPAPGEVTPGLRRGQTVYTGAAGLG